MVAVERTVMLGQTEVTLIGELNNSWQTEVTDIELNGEPVSDRMFRAFYKKFGNQWETDLANTHYERN